MVRSGALHTFFSFFTIYLLQHFPPGNKREIGYEKKKKRKQQTITQKQHEENVENLTSSKNQLFSKWKKAKKTTNLYF